MKNVITQYTEFLTDDFSLVCGVVGNKNTKNEVCTGMTNESKIHVPTNIQLFNINLFLICLFFNLYSDYTHCGYSVALTILTLNEQYFRTNQINTNTFDKILEITKVLINEASSYN